MSSVSSPPYSTGSKSFDPEQLLQDEEKLKQPMLFWGRVTSAPPSLSISLFLRTIATCTTPLPASHLHKSNKLSSKVISMVCTTGIRWRWQVCGSCLLMHFVVCVILRLELPTFLSTTITASFPFSCFPFLQLGHPLQTNISLYVHLLAQ
jgi:hypothetical protein